MAARRPLRRFRPMSVPRMVIRHDLPWKTRAARFGMTAALLAMIAAAAFWIGLRFASPHVAASQQATAPSPAPTAAAPGEAAPDAGGVESQLTVLRSAQEQLLAQVKALESENTRLKEDLALFERFLPAQSGPQGIAVQGFTAELAKPNEVRYRILVMRTGQSSKNFEGDLELTVNLLHSGKAVTMTFPEKGSNDPTKFDLSFRYYQRVDGTLTLPDGAIVKSVQARVMEKGKMKAQQSVDL